jgi:uncharacterized membrane protein YhaH (DUF805 family)
MKYFIIVLNKYATFKGRARRSEYWYFVLFNVLFSIPFSITAVVTDMQFISTMYSLALLLPGIAVAVRRMHDVGKSGWFVLVPIYNLVLACTPGDVGPNEYGEDPKAAPVTS